MSKVDDKAIVAPVDDDDDEPDDWDKRIFSTGCAAEQTKMNDCYYDKRDWRKCSKEVSFCVLEAIFHGQLPAQVQYHRHI
ncbi:hypothetical protein LOZ58_004908 [Ophidiomyces ophidiicola]|nr:hypothetical protein LOZ65_002792 [Ophidiomyces ophidiicola]KAI1958871.1 hypothetical protein LOZ58_004908 [Ophidiomyces ophidiicola]